MQRYLVQLRCQQGTQWRLDWPLIETTCLHLVGSGTTDRANHSWSSRGLVPKRRGTRFTWLSLGGPMATISLSSHWDHPLARFHYLAPSTWLTRVFPAPPEPHEVAQIHAAARVSEKTLRHVRTEAIQIEDWEGGRWKVKRLHFLLFIAFLSVL